MKSAVYLNQEIFVRFRQTYAVAHLFYAPNSISEIKTSVVAENSSYSYVGAASTLPTHEKPRVYSNCSRLQYEVIFQEPLDYQRQTYYVGCF